MYTKLEISNFRAFKSLTVAPLNRLNLIAGDNNIGKTGILEAICFANSDPERLRLLPTLFRRPQSGLSNQARDDADNFWLWLFHKKNFGQAWKIVLTGESGAQHGATARLVIDDGIAHAPFLSGASPIDGTLQFFVGAPAVETEVSFSIKDGPRILRGVLGASKVALCVVATRQADPTTDAELVNAIAVRNEEDELIEYLKLVEPRLNKLKYLRLPGHEFPYVYADIGFGRGKDLIPATQLGQAFSRLLSLFSKIMVERVDVLLIDEFENGLQHDALVPIWKALDLLARNRGIQVFATTHSYECIQAAHEAASAAPDYDLGVVRLQWTREQEVEAVVLDRENIATALDSRLEVR
jgi:AAA domain, putative AbiEii toxin, Type IV TA system/AAA domain